MRAGLLTETIHIYDLRKNTSDTGSQIEKYVETHKIRAARKKLTASVGSGLNASEVFIANTLVFQVRKYPFLNENVRIKYGTSMYKVISLDIQLDKTYLMTCSKINK